jgi:hypothetical protein
MTTLHSRFAEATISSRTNTHSEFSTNFSTSRLIENCSIASQLKSQDAAKYVTWAVVLVTLPAISGNGESLQPGGLLLLAFHTGDEVLHESELWGRSISMDFFLFQPSKIRERVEGAGLAIEEIIEREPYPLEVEYQSRRAYIFARKPGSILGGQLTTPASQQDTKREFPPRCHL